MNYYYEKSGILDSEVNMSQYQDGAYDFTTIDLKFSRIGLDMIYSF